MNTVIKKFDMSAKPVRQRNILRPIIWGLALPSVSLNGSIITKINCEGLKPPYLLLCNHNSFYDFKVATKAIFPHRANYVVAIDGFLRREWLLRNVGGICKRKFTSDIRLIRQIKRVFDNGDILVLYPEARYSLCGTTAVLPDSLGALCHIMGVPVVTLICHGHHLNSPFWNTRKRNVKGMTAQMKLLFTAEQTKKLTANEMIESIRKEFLYDDFAWQKENHIKVDAPFRAEGLHKVLYKCPSCGIEYRMTSKGTVLFCETCGKRWQMTEYGELKAENGNTEFSHIPDWYEWEREEVRSEVEAGTYYFKAECHVNSLPNAKRFIPLGEGTIIHDMNGFHLNGKDEAGDFSMEKSVNNLYSCHIEYEYLRKYGDCICLNTLEDTYYIYPHGRDFSVTKIALATEELYSKWCCPLTNSNKILKRSQLGS